MNLLHGFAVFQKKQIIYFLVVFKRILKFYFNLQIKIGGDDMKLILYDLRSEITEKRISQINKKFIYFYINIFIYHIYRTHTMGVTALKFKRNSPNNFYSGW